MSELIKNMDKKKITMGIIGCIFIVFCLIAGSLIYYNFFNSKSYSQVEDIMVNAAKMYYSNHKDALPLNIGEIDNVKVSTLVSGGYMKTIAEYIKDEDVACKGSVNVTNINNNYRYVPMLDCGKYYSYQTLISYIQKNENVVTSKDGLYFLGDDLVYRGEKVKNNVKFAGADWKIMKISNNKIYLIYQDGYEFDEVVWDDRYNKTENDDVGINNFQVSRIKDSLTSLYKDDSIFSDADKLLLSNFNVSIGKIGEEDNDKSGELEKLAVIENQYVSLITISDYMNASIDADCVTATSLSCSNYNYLTSYERSYWSITADKSNTYKVFKISDTAFTNEANSYSNLRPVVAIVSDALYVSGNGSESKPYVFK